MGFRAQMSLAPVIPGSAAAQGWRRRDRRVRQGPARECAGRPLARRSGIQRLGASPRGGWQALAVISAGNAGIAPATVG